MVQGAYPVVVTDRLAECRRFYVGELGFRVVFEASWFVYLVAAGEGERGIAFMAPDHPSTPPGPEAFNGEGLLFTLQVTDAAAEFARLRELGVAIDHPLRDEPWGQRRFGLRDPAGVWVDVVQQIEPEPGFWERYAV
jgi:catechol 2,3-dioxygenase-like lactoylglutathione lyase family enzyme